MITAYNWLVDKEEHQHKLRAQDYQSQLNPLLTHDHLPCDVSKQATIRKGSSSVFEILETDFQNLSLNSSTKVLVKRKYIITEYDSFQQLACVYRFLSPHAALHFSMSST